MQYMEFIAARADTGAALPLAKVTVYLAGTTTKAALFNLAGTSVANPVSADSNGEVGFAAANGAYDISIASSDGSYTVPTINKVQFYDLTELDGKVTTATAAATTAQTARDEVVNTAAGMAGLDPVARSNDVLRKPAGFLASNISNRIALQADGTWKGPTSGANPWGVEFDFPVTPGSTQYIDWLDVTGATLTVEERSASAQTVAPITPPLVAGRRRQTITTNAATTIVRVKIAGTAANVAFSSPSVTSGRPATVPNDGQMLSLLMDRILSTEGAAIGAGIYFSNTTAGSVISTSGKAITVATGTIFNARHGLTTPPQTDFVVLVTISGANYAPRALTITPRCSDGTSGAAVNVMALRWGEDARRFLVSLPRRVAGAQVTAFDLAGDTSPGGGPNIGSGGSMTVTCEAFSTANVPAFRSVPTLIAKAITDQAAATLAAATTSAAEAIELAYRRNIYRPAPAEVAGHRDWLSDMAQFFFSPSKGSDANAGSNAWAPKKLFKSVVQTVGAITAGRSLLFARGERHYIGFMQYGVGDVHYGAFGRSNNNARTSTGKRVDNRYVLDNRKDMSNLVWTSSVVGGNTIWKATVTLDFTTVMSGTNITSTQLPLWDARSSPIGTTLTMQYGGGSITANAALVAATPGSGTINKTGSTVADPRLDSNGTQYDITVRLADDADPNGKPILISQRDSGMFIAGGSITDAVLMGGSGKDGNDVVPSAIDGTFVELANTRFHSVGHGNVGPIKTTASNWFIGMPSPARASGKTAPEILGRTGNGSGGLHLFAPGNYQDRDIEILGTQYIFNHTNAVYGHISAAPGGYRNGYIEDIVVANSTTALKFDSAPPPGTLFTGTLTVDRLYSGPYTDPETGIYYDGNDVCLAPGYASTVYVNSVEHIGSLYTTQNSGGFFQANAQGVYHIGRWGGFTHTARHKVAVAGGTVIQGVTFDNLASNTLVANTGANGTMPVIHFYGGRDLSPTGKKAQLGAAAASGGLANAWDMELHLHSAFLDRYGNPGPEIPGVYGCLTPATRTSVPTRLFVYANQTFGLREYTRAQIIAYYLSLGGVQGTAANPLLAADGVTPATFYIDPETWIVNVIGAIIDVPESLK